MEKLSNYINHYVLVVDESWSMHYLKKTVVEVVDSLNKHLAEKSQDLNQETRLSVYAFNSRGTERCLVWDIDVLRMPSINGMYEPAGNTALLDCTLLAIQDLKTVPQKYGDHSFIIYVITDGQENNSFNRYNFKPEVDSLPDNWTLGVFVPDNRAVKEAGQWGFPKDNIQIWNPASAKGLEDVGSVLRSTSTQLMQSRKAGIRGTKSLFKLNTVTTSEIKANLTPLGHSEYLVLAVSADDRIDNFVNRRTGKPYQLGKAYYQLTKTETIQPQKSIALLSEGRIYVGAAARQMLGLPNEHVKVNPSDHTNYTIFVQSTSLNRKLLQGTNLLVLK